MKIIPKACIALLLITFVRLSATQVVAVRASGSGNVASRTVIELSAAATYDVVPENSGKTYKIIVANCEPGDSSPQYKPNKHILGKIQISQVGTSTVIQITNQSPAKYRQLSMKKPFRIVLDLTSQNIKTKSDKIALANFYTRIGNYNKAEELFGTTDKEFPADGEVIYHWGLLKTKRKHKSAALELLGQIPKGYPYHDSAQKLISQFKDGKYPQIDDQELENVAFEETQAEAADSVATAKPRPRKTPASKKARGFDMAKTISRVQPLLPYAGGSVALLLLAFLLIKSAVFKRRPKPEIEDVEDVSSLEEIDDNDVWDDETKSRLIGKLANDGWKAAEIANELHLNVKEVKRILQKPRFD